MNAVFYRDCTLVRATPDMIMWGGGNYLIFRYLDYNRFTSDGSQRSFGAISAAFFISCRRCCSSSDAIHRVEYCVHRVEYCDHRIADYLFDN